MIGVEWKNVQEPVREMFATVTKAVREQSADMARMLARMDTFVSRDAVLANQNDLYTRRDGRALELGKASVEAVAGLEARLDESQIQMAQMAVVMQHQTTAITDLNFRLEGAQRQLQEQEELHVSPAHAFDDVYTHVAAVQAELRAEQALALQTGLQAKQDRAKEGHVPEHIAAALEGLSQELERQARLLDGRGASVDAALAEARAAHTALQEQLHAVDKQAVTGALRAESAAREFSKEIFSHESRTTGERLAAAEQALRGVRDGAREAAEEQSRELEGRVARGVRDALDNSSVVSAAQVEAILERVLGSKPYGDASAADVRSAVAENNVLMRGDADKAAELLRRELQLQQQQHTKDWFNQFECKVQVVAASFDALRADNEAERSRLGEQAAEVLRALKKKADQADVRALVRGVRGGEDMGPDERAAAAAAALLQREQEDRMSDLVSDVARLRKVTAAADALVKTELREKLNAADVEALLADVVGKATGRPVTEQKSSSSSSGGNKPWQKSARSVQSSATYVWRNTLRGGDADAKQALDARGNSLRAELCERPDRAEVLSMLLAEGHPNNRRIEALQRDVGAKADGAAFAKAEHMVQLLHERVVSELTCGLWLWTSRQLVPVGPADDSSHMQLLPWDTEAVNAAPSSLVWRRGSSEITIKLPGLYRVGVAVFSCLPVSITILLNGQPILELAPDTRHDRSTSSPYAQGLRGGEERYLLRRLRHAEGDVTGVSMDEPLSLPANAVISVGYQSATVSQAYLSLRKL